MKKNNYTLSVLAGLALTVGSANAALVGELGVMQPTADGGINPQTGLAWAAGDQYRLAFYTSTTRNSASGNCWRIRGQQAEANQSTPSTLGA